MERPALASPVKPRIAINEQKVAQVKADLDRQEREGEWSDVDDEGYATALETYKAHSLKRRHEREIEGEQKRVVSFTLATFSSILFYEY